MAVIVKSGAADKSINLSLQRITGLLKLLSLMSTTSPVSPFESLTLLWMYDDATFLKNGSANLGSSVEKHSCS